MASDDKRPRVDEDWKNKVELERAAASDREEESDDQEAVFAPGFEGIVQMLVMQALMALGALTDPDEDSEIQVDLGAGKQLIEMLEALQEKTAGNLTDEETQLLGHHLTQLRMMYVEIQRHIEPQAKKSRIELP